jgi:hypothetical protein
MKHFKIVLIFLIVFLSFFPFLLQAETNSPISPGMSQEQVLGNFGEPDRRVVNEDSSKETWHYGGAVIFFSNRVVSAWSGGSGLNDRALLSRLRSEGGAEQDYYLSNYWLNDWTAQRRASRQYIVDGVIHDLSKVSSKN